MLSPKATVRFIKNVSYSFYRMHLESNGGVMPDIINEDPEYFISYTNGELTGF